MNLSFMDNMKEKYQKNMAAGEMLSSSDKQLYTSSIHCFYYAVLQCMKYRLAHLEENSISYTEQEERAERGNGSHEFVINEIANRMNAKPKDVRGFKEDIRILKQNRVLADYSERMFTQEESLECRAQAERLITNINRFTKVAV